MDESPPRSLCAGWAGRLDDGITSATVEGEGFGSSKSGSLSAIARESQAGRASEPCEEEARDEVAALWAGRVARWSRLRFVCSGRDLLAGSKIGHVDLPRLVEGGEGGEGGVDKSFHGALAQSADPRR
jgi:hypothetical protein